MLLVTFPNNIHKHSVKSLKVVPDTNQGRRIMKMSEQKVDETSLDYVTGLINASEALAGLDRADAECVLNGKEGVLYEAYQDEGEDNLTFLNGFFSEMKKRKPVLASTNFLMYLGENAAAPVMLEEIAIIPEFFACVEHDDVEVKWGMRDNKEGEPMSLLMVCTKSVNN